ncbi:hypothetical protein D1007_25335 [Hordeum vulgare]|nr:hypothetical protein D1007_25335 [Hordeum vulgare]
MKGCPHSTICCVGKKSPNDKAGLGFNSNKKKKHKSFKKKGQEEVKNWAKIIFFKCKIEGNHVRSCQLKKKPHSDKQQEKRPQVHSHAQPRVEDRPVANNTQVNASHVEKSSEKKVKSRHCYSYCEKGHVASSCTKGDMLALQVTFACVFGVKMM